MGQTQPSKGEKKEGAGQEDRAKMGEQSTRALGGVTPKSKEEGGDSKKLRAKNNWRCGGGPKNKISQNGRPMGSWGGSQVNAGSNPPPQPSKKEIIFIVQ